MAGEALTPELIELVAQRFQALAEPARLAILQTLRSGERTVGEVVEETGMAQPNVSKHLQQLYTLGFVERRKEGLHVHYRLADEDVFEICDIMCGRLEREAERRQALLEGRR